METYQTLSLYYKEIKKYHEGALCALRFACEWIIAGEQPEGLGEYNTAADLLEKEVEPFFDILKPAVANIKASLLNIDYCLGKIKTTPEFKQDNQYSKILDLVCNAKESVSIIKRILSSFENYNGGY